MDVGDLNPTLIASYNEAIAKTLLEGPATGLLALKSGWGDLFAETLGVEIEIGGTPFSSLLTPSRFYSHREELRLFNSPGIMDLDVAIDMHRSFLIRGDVWDTIPVKNLEKIKQHSL